ncbi:MAG: hypothetical protein Q8P67_23600 [archaeon]|nr:hypothetical protein [archaeon]
MQEVFPFLFRASSTQKQQTLKNKPKKKRTKNPPFFVEAGLTDFLGWGDGIGGSEQLCTSLVDANTWKKNASLPIKLWDARQNQKSARVALVICFPLVVERKDGRRRNVCPQPCG